MAEDEMFRVVRSGKRKSKYSLHQELLIYLLIAFFYEFIYVLLLGKGKEM